MTIAELVPLLLTVSIFLMVLTLGLKSAPSDLAAVLRRPGLLLRSWLAMSVVMLALAVTLTKIMALPHVVAVALIATSLAPVPPMLPNRQVKAGGDRPYAIGLLFAGALISIIWIPVAVALLNLIADNPLRMPPGKLLPVIALSVILPLTLGTVTNKLAPEPSATIARIVAPISVLLLAVATSAVIATSWNAIAAHARDGAVLAFAIFAIAGLIIGYLAGGPEPHTRSVLALASATRHPGVAIVIATVNFPGDKTFAPAVLLCLLTAMVVTTPFVLWSKRRGRDNVQQSRISRVFTAD